MRNNCHPPDRLDLQSRNPLVVGPSRASRKGSALLVTLMVVSLLLVVVLAMVARVRLELRNTTNHQNLMIARANARLGMELGLARLQEMAGKDGRVTARASLFEEGPLQVQDPQLNWTGVWNSSVEASPVPTGGIQLGASLSNHASEHGVFLGWLVSRAGYTDNPANPATNYEEANPESLDSVEIVGPRVQPGDGVRHVRVPTVKIESPATVGRYAFWVGGENEKANVTVFDDYQSVTYDYSDYRVTEPPLSSAGENYTLNEFKERERLRQLINRQLRLNPVLPGISFPPADTLRSLVLRVSGMNDMGHVFSANPNLEFGDYVHDLTTTSFSLLANVPEGRLKYDLSDANFIINQTAASQMLRLDGSGTPGSVLHNIGKFMGDAPGLPDRHLATRLGRRSALNPGHYRANTSYTNNRFRKDSGLENGTVIQYPHESVFVSAISHKYLIVTEVGVKVTVYQSDINGRTPKYPNNPEPDYIVPAPGGQEYYAIAFEVFLEVWNPYNHIIRANPGHAMRNVGIRLEGLPVLGLPNGATIPLDDYFSKLVFDTVGLGTFMPGQIKLGVPDRMYAKTNPTDTAPTETDFYSAPNQNYADNTSWPFNVNPVTFQYNTMRLTSYDPNEGLPIPVFHLVTNTPAPVTIADGVPVSSFTVNVGDVADGNLRYFEVDATRGGGGTGNIVPGEFQSASYSVPDGYDVDLFSMHMGWGNTLGPNDSSLEAHRLFFIEFLRDIDIRKKQNLPYRDLLTSASPFLWARDPRHNGGVEPNAVWIDSGGDRYFFADPEFNGPGYALYEFTRQEPLSPMAFTFEPADHPYAIGNPWGGDANRVFDSVFFSSLPRTTIPAEEFNFETFTLWNEHLPNNYVMIYEDKFNPALPGMVNNKQTFQGGEYYNEESLTGMMRADQSAANLMLRAGFNVNSTSVNAWKVMLAGATLGDPDDPASSPFLYRGDAGHPRNANAKPLYQNGGSGNGSGSVRLKNAHFQFTQSADTLTSYYDNTALQNLASEAAGGNSDAIKEFQRVVLSQGIRELTQSQIDFLATSIVTEIKKYAAGQSPYASSGGKPFMSVRDFMNSGILDRILQPSYGGGANHPNAVVKEYPYAPAYLSQAHLLSGIAHLLTPRSDTFTIRGYGDIGGATSHQASARAICEVVVQRVPTPLNTATDALPSVDLSAGDPHSAYRDQKLAINQLDETKHPFGRRFKILSFRWIE